MKENLAWLTEETNQHGQEKKIKRLYDANPLLEHLGITYEKRDSGLVLKLTVTHKDANLYGLAHGAVLFAMADTAMGWACHAEGMRQVVTLDSSVNFIRPVPEGTNIYAVGKVIHAGRRTAVCESWVYTEEEELCLKAQGTFYVLDAEDGKK